MSYNDRKRVAAALGPIYTAVNEEAALAALEAFAASELGARYPATVAAWRQAWERFVPFLAFVPATRKVTDLHDQLDRGVELPAAESHDKPGAFPNDAAAVKLLWLAMGNIEDKRARERAKEAGLPKGANRKAPGKLVEGATIQGWTKALNELALRYPEYALKCDEPTNDPLRSRGRSNSIGPTSMATVFGVVPLRELSDLLPAGSFFSYPR